MIPRWLVALFKKPRHVAYRPNPAYTLLETYRWARMPVAVQTVHGQIGETPVVARIALMGVGVN